MEEAAFDDNPDCYAVYSKLHNGMYCKDIKSPIVLCFIGNPNKISNIIKR